MPLTMTGSQTNFLFWNLHKKPITQNIVRAVKSHAVDVLLIAETAYSDNPGLLVGALNSGPHQSGESEFSFLGNNVRTKVQVFSRLNSSQWQIKVSRKFYTIWSVSSDAGRQICLATVHFPSVQTDQGDGQRRVAMELKDDLQQQSAMNGQGWQGWNEFPVVVCGDFNANPFDPGISGIYGLNANPSRQLILRGNGARTIDHRSYPYLYNPMWRLLGGSHSEQNGVPLLGSSAEIYGTYYNAGLSKSVDPFWYVLDQVLVGPGLLSSFQDEDMQVLTRDAENGGVSLISENGLPRTPDYPDHLPLFFRLRV